MAKSRWSSRRVTSCGVGLGAILRDVVAHGSTRCSRRARATLRGFRHEVGRGHGTRRRGVCERQGRSAGPRPRWKLGVISRRHARDEKRMRSSRAPATWFAATRQPVEEYRG
jgi:hypothetical protein